MDLKTIALLCLLIAGTCHAQSLPKEARLLAQRWENNSEGWAKVLVFACEVENPFPFLVSFFRREGWRPIGSSWQKTYPDMGWGEYRADILDFGKGRQQATLEVWSMPRISQWKVQLDKDIPPEVKARMGRLPPFPGQVDSFGLYPDGRSTVVEYEVTASPHVIDAHLFRAGLEKMQELQDVVDTYWKENPAPEDSGFTDDRGKLPDPPEFWASRSMDPWLQAMVLRVPGAPTRVTISTIWGGQEYASLLESMLGTFPGFGSWSLESGLPVTTEE